MNVWLRGEGAQMPSLRPIIPITEDQIVEMSPADSSIRSRSLSFRDRIEEVRVVLG